MLQLASLNQDEESQQSLDGGTLRVIEAALTKSESDVEVNRN